MRPPFLRPGFMVIHGNQPDALRALLVQWITRHPLGPLETEVVLVQSNGIAQWLKLALAQDADAAAGSGGCGIAAALDAQLPSRFLWQVYRAVLGEDAVPRTSPFDKALMTWRLMRLLPTLLEDPTFVPLRRFLARDADMRKRYQLAERLADLFDQYQVYRADWLEGWANGRDDIQTSRQGTQPIAASLAWQPRLWRALLEDVGRDHRDDREAEESGNEGDARARSSRAEIHRRFLTRIAHMRASVARRVRGTTDARDAASLDADVSDAADTIDWNAIPDEVLQPAVDATRARMLPRRLIVFGISSLPQQALEVLSAIAPWTQVLLCVHNPCRHYWADIIADKDLLRATRARQSRKSSMPAILDDTQLHQHAHPLLAAWGKQGRDFIGLLDQHDDAQSYAARFADIDRRIDLFESYGETTLLQQLQDDILALRPLGETRERWPAVDPDEDASIRFHRTHSTQREVEVLHDQLLAAFADDPTLQPRDVIVMVPDIDHYAPHVQAVFGLTVTRDPRHVPYQLADQGALRHDPLLGAVEMLLGLPQSRLALSDVLDLLDVPALRARFGIAEGDLPLLRRWMVGANIRWGLDAAQREDVAWPDSDDAESAEGRGNLPDLNAGRVGVPEQNSWLFGLRRMLLGYAVGSDAAWRGIEPLDEIGGLDAALLGPLTHLLDTLHRYWRLLRDTVSPSDWGVRLRGLLADCFDVDALAGVGDGNGKGADGRNGAWTSGEIESRDGLTLLRLDATLQSWLDACAESRMTDAIPLSVVREHWLAQMEQRGLSQPFFAGAVTFATLMPMRAIPFRMVCLLGMNDGDYPRTRVPMDFDLMAADYRPGDRSRREDDRYLFLEAVLSARDRLHISWVGRSIHDNSERPTSVLVAQLRDHLAAGWRLARQDDDGAAPASTALLSVGHDDALLSALTVDHRMQPFNRAYFADTGDPRLFSFAREWRDGLVAQAEARRQRTINSVPVAATGLASVSRQSSPLPPIAWDGELTVHHLVDFLRNPVRAFFRTRLKVTFETDDPIGEDQEPFVVDGLQTWALQDELIRRRGAVQRALLSGDAHGAVDGNAAHHVAADQAAIAATLDAVVDAQLRRFARRGALPVGAFGDAAVAALREPLVPLFAQYDGLLANWPHRLPDEALDYRYPIDAVDGDADARQILDWITGLRGADDGARARIVTSSSALISTTQSYRRDRAIPHWVEHLAAHISGGPLTTWVLSKKGEMQFAPIADADALAFWQALLRAWEIGMRAPLPLAIRAGFTWLERGGARAGHLSDGDDIRPGAAQASAVPDAVVPDVDPGGPGSDAWEAARAVYEDGASTTPAERDENPYLGRAFPTFASLWAHGDAAYWTRTLLEPIYHALPRKHRTKGER
ncbi:exodeoxyribonuclease V subunit gamma [Robbsia andropogonis]|uniref:exodeoxyribonuclease V subunit gamma n=1 Tax=Robbsia andropogonis TaxID=28092 RepID=UPI003D263774